jgi:hypothetical protein
MRILTNKQLEEVWSRAAEAGGWIQRIEIVNYLLDLKDISSSETAELIEAIIKDITAMHQHEGEEWDVLDG